MIAALWVAGSFSAKIAGSFSAKIAVSGAELKSRCGFVPETAISDGLSGVGAILRGMGADELAASAAEQGGLFTRAQARGCGFSEFQVRRRLRTGEWQPVLGSVLARAGLVVTPRMRDRAAQLAVPGSVLAGPSAARRHGLPIRDHRTYLAVGPANHPRTAGIHLLRESIRDSDVELIDGLLVTARDRTVFDCLRVLPDAEATDFLDRALQARWTVPEQFAARVHRFVGRRGAERLARFSRLAGSGARSTAERLMVLLLRRAGISGWRANAEIHDDGGLVGVADLVFRRCRLIVEIDGRAHHTDSVSFQRDRERQNRLVAAGWTVLRFTWRDLTEHPAEVIATIRRMIAVSGANPHRDFRSVPGTAIERG